MSRPMSLASLLLAGAAPVFMAAAAHAQTPPASGQGAGNGAALEQIVVTATRRSQVLQKVPMSVNVVTGAQLKKYQIFNVSDVQQLTPGLEITNETGRNNIATIRGITFDPDSGTLPAVDVFLNEIPVDAQTAFTAIYDMKQIEVLNGPQGLFRGRTAPAGLITMATQPADPTRYTGYAQGTLTDRNAHNFQGAVNIPLIADKLALRVAGDLDGNDLNQVKDVTNGDRSHSSTKSTRVSLAFDPTPDVSLKFAWQYLYAANEQLTQVVGPGAKLPASGFGRLVPNGPPIAADQYLGVQGSPSTYINRNNLFTLDGEWHVSEDTTLSLNAGHQDANLNQSIERNSANAPPGFKEPEDVLVNYSVDYGELRLASDNGGFWNYMAGASFDREQTPTFVKEANDDFLTGVPGFSFFPHYVLIPVNVNISVPGENNTYSAYLASSFQLAEKWKLDLGVRYSFYRAHQQSFLTVFASGAEVINDLGTISPHLALRNNEAVTGGGDLSYAMTPETNLYLSYGHSYRPGSAAVGVTVPLESQLIVTNPETSNAIELGAKGTGFGNRINYTTDIFYQRFDGYLDRTPYNVNVSSAANGSVDSTLAANFNGNAVSAGVEASVNANVTPDWNLGYNMSWVDAHFDNASEPCNKLSANGTPVIPIGQEAVFCTTSARIADTAKFHMTLTTEYDYPLERVTPFVRALFSYSPGFRATDLDYNFEGLPLLNVYAGLRSADGHWELMAYAKNALDIQRVTGVQTQGNYTQATVAEGSAGGLVGAQSFNSGYQLVTTSPPIEAGLTMRYSF